MKRKLIRLPCSLSQIRDITAGIPLFSKDWKKILHNPKKCQDCKRRIKEQIDD